MVKTVHIILLMAAAFLPFTTRATEQTDLSDPLIVDTIALVIDEAVQDAPVPDTILVNAIDSALYQSLSNQLSGEEYSLDADLFRQYNGPDFHFRKNFTNPAAKPYTFMQDQTWVGLPVFVSGLIAKSEKAAFRQDYINLNTRIRLVKYNFHTHIDDYIQFTGLAMTLGLKMSGVEGRSSWPRLFASSAASYLVMAGLVNSIKYTTNEIRPDGGAHNSWPSGHTATAFVGATILHKEYGLTRSPWYSIAGYTVATASGVLRVLNNRHWVSDVLSGAGIGILSTELAYGICDLLFKDKGLLMNDLAYYPDLSKNPSFFSISMGIGFGNKNLTLPAFDRDFPAELMPEDGQGNNTGPLKLQFRSATAVGVEGAWFITPYVGIGGRLRVKSTPIKGWNIFANAQGDSISMIQHSPAILDAIDFIDIIIESDHITEFAGDAGLFFSLPLSSRFAIGTKILVGRSIMSDLEVKAVLEGKQLRLRGDHPLSYFDKTDIDVHYEWPLINVHASNSMKLGSGLSFTYAYKNSFSWRLFCDYDYASKTYVASYRPYEFFNELAPTLVTGLKKYYNWDLSKILTSSVHKRLHQWVLGGALCVSF